MSLERLWTPWRYSYVNKGNTSGCVFCHALTENQDPQNLIVHRGKCTFSIMNLYPYNTAHVMTLPNEHLGDIEETSPEIRNEISDMLPLLVKSIRRGYSPDAFNVGINLGEDAGAGIAQHLHQHIVPRWRGDANFMPITGGVKVLPELLPATYARIRTELWRTLSNRHDLQLLLLDPEHHIVLIENQLPLIQVEPSQSSWSAAQKYLSQFVNSASLIGWAGKSNALLESEEIPVLAVQITLSRPQASAIQVMAPDSSQLPVSIAETAERARWLFESTI